MKRLITVALGLLGVLALGGVARGELFKDGETVCFLGDSITARGSTQTIIADYYLTRFAERAIRFVNAGRSGDSAGGALGRLQDDVIAKKPTSVTIMLGMNDVGRGSYVAHPDAGKLKQQQQSLNSYKTNMEKVVARIRAEAGEPKLLFITPSPFDQTVVLEKENNQPGCNDGLGRCAEFVRALAATNHGTVVDFHAPMTALNLEQQQKDQKWTIVGGDRVHPGAPGHLMMAWLFLKAQGAPAVVSSVKVDAAAGRAVESLNAKVTKVTKQDGGVAFTVLGKALPFPIDPAAKPVLGLLPIEKDLNQELLVVSGLAEGTYEVRIDGAVVARHTASELAKGINLAFNEATPQFKQAQSVARHNEQRRGAESQACSLMNTRRWMQNHYKVNVDDPAAVQAHYDHFTDKKEYNAGMTLNYIKNWSKHGDLLKQVAAHEKDALVARAPVPHTYAVVPVAAGGQAK
jgi:lysophospholipase L1-like esterase